MRGHDRHARRFDDVVKGLVGDVGDVDDHPQVVHGADDVAAEAGQAVVHGFVARRIAPGVRVYVRQGHVAHAAGVEVAQDVEGVLDGVAPFHSDHESAYVL